MKVLNLLRKYWLAVLCLVLISPPLYMLYLYKNLPKTDSLMDYHPPLVTLVYDRSGKVIGEFFKERRVLTSYEDFPRHLIQAFISAEDGRFFEHKGVNYRAIFRALLANIKAGKKVQGGSTITQQVARSLLLSSKKTYTRKLREVMLAWQMESRLTKEEILYLYLNQIYLGHGAYGVGMAGRIYFKKSVQDLTIEESTLLAGLPQAPSRFSPISNAKKAKSRQIYVLSRMVEEGYISEQQAEVIKNRSVKIFMRENYSSKAPYFIETLRQLLVSAIGEEELLTGGFAVHTSLDYNLQQIAQEELKKGLKELDKRQGYRGPLKNIPSQEVLEFLSGWQNKWVKDHKNYQILLNTGEDGAPSIDKLSFGDLTQGVVSQVEDGVAYVDLIFSQKGVISLKTSQWARKPNKKIDFSFSRVDSLKNIFKTGDVVWVQIADPQLHPEIKSELGEEFKEFYVLTLEQEPLAEGALISFDQKTEDIVAMIGGYQFSRSQFNRTYQAKRQTGSAFKPIVYAAALDKGFTPSSIIADEPVTYEDEEADLLLSENDSKAKGQWRPSNYSQYFTGDILFRNALIRSLNIPTVKLIEKIGVPWVEFYSRRLGVVSPLNSDYTVALGSSSITLYEMTKAYSIFGKKGKRIQPLMAKQVLSLQGDTVIENLSLDQKFQESLQAFQDEFKKAWDVYWESKEPDLSSSIFFEDLQQVISEETAYLMTSLLKGVIFDPYGTGGKARSIKFPVAGKTGTTNGYYDAWFIGYSSHISTGVWVGFDHEESLGQSETGARAALPIWLNFMKKAHQSLELKEFEVPKTIVFANIDNETGYLAQSDSKEVVRQAFIEGTEPKEQKAIAADHEDQNFLREDMAL